MAILHVVAANRKALDAILSDKRADVRVFEVGKHGKESIETELKKYKKDFSLEVTVQVVARGANEKTLKNLHFGPGSLSKNLAM